MHWFSSAVFVAVVCLIAEHEVRTFRLELQALDAMEPLLRFQKPYFSLPESNASDGELGEETLADVLLSPSWDVGDFPINNVSESCHAIMHHFATQGGNFTYCLLSHSRPFRVCEKCVTHYVRVTHLYEDLLNYKKCAPMLLMADKIQVMTTLYNVFTTTWSKANCDRCFDSVQENTTTGEVTYSFTAETLLFQEMQANVSQCFNDSDTVHDPKKKSSPVCIDCKSVYSAMNNNYKQLSKDSGNKICMDLVDMMNQTRLKWSSHFYCRGQNPDASVVIVITVMVFIVTIVLYTSSKFIAKIRMPQIFKAKRMVTKVGQYGALNHEEVNTSLPRFATSPTRSMESLRTDSFRDLNGNGHPNTTEQST